MNLSVKTPGNDGKRKTGPETESYLLYRRNFLIMPAASDGFSSWI